MNCLDKCYGFAMLQNMHGKKNLSCDYLKNMNIHMPYNLIVNDCKMSIKGNHICDSNNFSCNSLMIFILSILMNVFLLLTIVSLIYVRYVFLKNCLKKRNLKVKYNKIENKIKISGANTNRSLSKKEFILYLLCGLPFSKSCLIETNNNLIIGNSGETICLTEGNITVPEILREIKMSLMYQTSHWTLDPQITWACVGGQCPTIPDCESMEISNAKFTDNNNQIKKQVCKSIPKGCFFGRGCLVGDLILNIKSLSKVYKIDNILSSHKDIIHSKYCSITFKTFINNYDLNYAIVEYDRDFWLCPSYNTEFKIGFNVLGDLQIFNNKTIIFPWYQIMCGKDWYEDKCSIPTSFMIDINDYCEYIDNGGITSIGKIIKKDKSLYIMEKSNINIALSCPNELETIIEDPQCSEAEVEIWGIREHSTGVYLAIRAFSKQKGATQIIKHPCKDDVIKIDCNGLYNFVPISEYTDCNATDKTTSNAEYYHYHDNIINDKSLYGMISNLSWPHYNILGSLGLSAIFWIVIILYLIKK